MSRFLFATFAICAACLMAQTGQSVAPAGPAAPPGEVLGVGNYIHVVANLDKSIEFYRDVIGLQLTGAPGPHVFSASAIVSSLYDAVGKDSRVASLRIPGSDMAVEIVEFKDIAGSPAQPRLQDPGAITLRLLVRDLDSVMGGVKQAKTPVVTTGGEPVNLDGKTGKTREVVVKDPDGIFIRLTQPDPVPVTAAPATSNIVGAAFGVTVSDSAKTAQLYRDVLGFPAQVDAAFHAEESELRVTGTPGAQFRRSTALVPGTAFQVEFLEFKGVDQRPAHPAIHDPGASVLRLRVRDLDRLLTALKMAGAAVASSGGEAVNLGRSRAVIVREPNSLFVQLLSAPAP
jgi:catechol 2,3-dioxygenase-like lactoylglutathione lyase family enzyme